jgi:hypothetical protein
MVKKAGVILLITVFVLSVAGAAFASPLWEDPDVLPPGQQKKLGIEEEDAQFGPPSFVLQMQQQHRLKVLERKQLLVHGKELISDLPPVIKDGRTLIPVRAVVMGLGADIEWDEEERTVTVTKGDVVVVIYLDEYKYEVNGEELVLDVPAQLLGNRTFVPLRFLAEALGERVGYNKENGMITIGDETNGDEVLKYFRVGGMDVLDLDGIEVDDPEDDDGASLEVPDFEDFEGIAVKAQDEEHTSLEATLNGVVIDEDDLDEQPLEDGDVIIVTAEVTEEENGDATVTAYYYKVTVVGVPSATFVFEKPSGLVETDEDISGFSVTVKNVRNIEDDVSLRYLMEVTRGDLDGKEIAYGDPVEGIFTIEDDQAYFGPSSGFTLDDLEGLMDDEGVTTPFTVKDGLEEGNYRFTISIVEVDGDILVTSHEFSFPVSPETDE